MKQQQILAIISSDMVINKKPSKTKKFYIFKVTFFSLKLFRTAFAVIVFIGNTYWNIFVTFMIVSHVITESSIARPKHLPFS